MAPRRRVPTWRGLNTCATLWLVLAVASTLEVYEEVPPVDSDFDNVYQDISYFGTGSDFTKPMQSKSAPYDVLLNEFLNARRLKMHGPDFTTPMQSKSEPYEQLLTELLNARSQKMDHRQTSNTLHRIPKLANEDYRNSGIQTVGVVKRLAEVFRGNWRQYRPSPQQKWKIKKGKVIGSQMVCYFKLCAFRSPA